MIKPRSRTFIVILTALFFVFFSNGTFFQKVIGVYGFSSHSAGFVISLGVVLSAIIALLLFLVTNRYTLKPLIITLFLVSALTNYFMHTYTVVIDESMIQNSLETNSSEAFDLLTVRLFLHLFFLGVIPSVLLYMTPIRYAHFKKELGISIFGIVVSLVLIVSMLFTFSPFYTSFFRENKPLRYYTNPTFYLYSVGKYLHTQWSKKDLVLKPLGRDAKVLHKSENPKLTVVVVGEAARADRFSLNGYERDTNPLLKKESVISLTNVSSCATSTALSVPCMFSHLERSNFSDKEARWSENVLDILARVGVSVLWRDNNSDSKGVALRVAYEDYKTPSLNPICDTECRDEGMLEGLQSYIDAQKGDVLVVLHQMGNHGPAYYKRYPKAHEYFTPVCSTNQIEQCTLEELNNAYDNVIRYTDTFLSKTIALLKNNDARFETALIYMADHGESLGEKGLFLHGIPYFMAPKEQTHIGALLWFGEKAGRKLDVDELKKRSSFAYSHDDLFHTLLGWYDVQTSVYDPKKDLFTKGKR